MKYNNILEGKQGNIMNRPVNYEKSYFESAFTCKVHLKQYLPSEKKNTSLC